MIRTLIVDDEILVRIGLKTMIDWEENGFLLVGEANDGEAALRLCQEQEVDLVITDIKMPRMDGIALIRALQDTPTKCVVLSCYHESEYVKEAMKYHGALDYIFKLGMEPEELLRTLDSVKKMIMQERARGDMPRTRGEQPGKRELLQRLLQPDGRADAPDLSALSTRLDRPFCCILAQAGEAARGGQQREMEMIAETTAGDLLRPAGAGFDVADLGEHLLILCNLPDGTDSLAVQLCERIRRTVRLVQERGVSCGVSRVHCGAPELQTACGEALEALERTFYRGLSKTIHYEDRRARQGSRTVLPGRNETLLLLYSRRFDALRERLRAYAADGDGGGRRRDCAAFIAFLSNLDTLLREQFGGDGIDARYVEQILRLRTLEEVAGYAVSRVDEAEAHLAGRQEDRLGRDILRCIDYINAHYASDIRLGDVARHAGFNESYLSHLFKKKLGVSFVEYLNEYRVRNAQELIVSTDLSLSQVARRVGYANYAYFSRLFKNLTGVNANELRAASAQKISKPSKDSASEN